MIGLPICSILWWNRSKAKGWTLDGTTLRILAEDIEREITSYEKISADIEDQASRDDFDTVFAADLAEARAALAEIQTARNAALTRKGFRT